MSYDEEQARRSRVVVETPTSDAKWSIHNLRDNSGISAGMVGVLVGGDRIDYNAGAFWMNSQPTTDENAALTAQQQPTVIQQLAPAQQPPVIIQQPAPATQPAPIIVTPPAGGSTTSGSTTSESVNMDSSIQTAVDKRLADDPMFSTLGITASVLTESDAHRDSQDGDNESRHRKGGQTDQGGETSRQPDYREWLICWPATE